MYSKIQENEAQMRDLKPGNLSDELRIALGMPVGPVRKMAFLLEFFYYMLWEI